MFGLNLDSLGDSKFMKKGSAAWSDTFKCFGFGAARKTAQYAVVTAFNQICSLRVNTIRYGVDWYLKLYA